VLVAARPAPSSVVMRVPPKRLLAYPSAELMEGTPVGLGSRDGAVPLLVGAGVGSRFPPGGFFRSPPTWALGGVLVGVEAVRGKMSGTEA